jgi:N-acetylmuramoyl-L-alanine amidase
MRPQALELAVATLALAALAACSHAPPPHGPSPPRDHAATRPRPKPGYEGRADDLSSVDASGLAGRRIALDPGHGGFFRGALGVNGLTEAEVNLGVALDLRGLLEARGAQVIMTRTDDRDFLTPADSTLRSDLAERVRIANAFHPDLFLSVHHNADARGAHDVNETQTYYKLGDQGPSLDAAQDVHRYLVRNLGIESQRILPGNYYVLRNSESPALLTESSYITNPDVESKLALAAKQRLEAEALYLGLARYFARRVPVIAEFVASAARGGPGDTSFSSVPAPFVRARIAGAFDHAELALDGASLPITRRGPILESSPGPLGSGAHVATLRVSLAGAGAAREQSVRFRITRPPARLIARLATPPVGSEGGFAAVRIEVRDSLGAFVSDSIAIRVRSGTARRVLPADTTLLATDGVAWSYARVAPQARAGLASASLRLTLASGSGSGTTLELATTASRPRDRWFGFARAMPGDRPLARALGTTEPEPRNPWLNRDGLVVLSDPAGRFVVPSLAGYRAWGTDTLPPRLVPIAAGALHGRRIVIDPDGGGDDAAGVGPSGARAANLNLEVARALGSMLEAAGAETRLTRDGDYALSDVERVEINEAFHSERFLRIGHRAESPRIGHYFSSVPGKKWAESVAHALERLGSIPPPLAEDAQYPLQQTSCPALYVSLARVDHRVAEERLLTPGALRAEAYALYLALAREWTPDSTYSTWSADSLTLRDAGGKPLAGAVVILGDALVLEADPSGRVHFARTEPGPLEVEVDHPALRFRRVLLDSDRGAVWTGPRDRPPSDEH